MTSPARKIQISSNKIRNAYFGVIVWTNTAGAEDLAISDNDITIDRNGLWHQQGGESGTATVSRVLSSSRSLTMQFIFIRTIDPT
jgi:hypothetical protein